MNDNIAFGYFSGVPPRLVDPAILMTTIAMNGMRQLMPHFVLVPLVAQGHMIPMVDIALLLAERGARVSLITTSVNADRIRGFINNVKESRLPVDFVELPFPCAEVGLPEGCENFDLLPQKDFSFPNDLYLSLFEANSKLQAPLESYLMAQQQHAGPMCMITDMCNYWTMPVAQKLRIPRLLFHGPSGLYILCSYVMNKHKVYDRITDPFELLVVPDVPHHLVVNTAQAPGFFNQPGRENLRHEVWNAEPSVDGVVINSFEDLEHEYIECYANAKGTKVWTIGPLCLHNKNLSFKAARGDKASIDTSKVLTWLDTKKTRSVIYISFGTLVRNSAAQLIEVGSGLEASKVPFIWVIKDAERTPEVEAWLSDGFQARVGDRGLVIPGWSPQAVILSHSAVGGTMTHCGWNSILEAVSEGLPMVTWPKFADQFINEKLVVDVLRVGVSIGVTVPINHQSTPEVVVREHVEKVILRLMDGGEEGRQRRERARELGQKARKAIEHGGSSHANTSDLIKFVMNFGT